jgi:hypothetical protein
MAMAKWMKAAIRHRAQVNFMGTPGAAIHAFGSDRFERRVDMRFAVLGVTGHKILPALPALPCFAQSCHDSIRPTVPAMAIRSHPCQDEPISPCLPCLANPQLAILSLSRPVMFRSTIPALPGADLP